MTGSRPIRFGPSRRQKRPSPPIATRLRRPVKLHASGIPWISCGGMKVLAFPLLPYRQHSPHGLPLRTRENREKRRKAAQKKAQEEEEAREREQQEKRASTESFVSPCFSFRLFSAVNPLLPHEGAGLHLTLSVPALPPSSSSKTRSVFRWLRARSGRGLRGFGRRSRPPSGFSWRGGGLSTERNTKRRGRRRQQSPASRQTPQHQPSRLATICGSARLPR